MLRKEKRVQTLVPPLMEHVLLGSQLKIELLHYQTLSFRIDALVLSDITESFDFGM